MNQLSKRQYSIFKTLNEAGKEIKSNDLCAYLNISQRTLRYEINNINNITETKIIFSNKNGYFIKKDDNFFKKISDIKVNDFLDEQKSLILALLNEKKINIFELEEECFLSQSKIISLLKPINLKMEIFNIHILKKGDYIYVNGDEHDKRRLLAHFFYNEINNLADNLNNFEDYFSHFKLSEINNLVSESILENNLEIDNIYFKNIVISLAIALQRIIDNFQLSIEKNSTLNDSTELYEYQFLKTFVDKANNHFNISIDSADFIYLQNFISGFFRQKDNNLQNNTLCNHEFEQKIHNILDCTMKHYKIDLDYSSFFDSFVLHVHYLLIRSKNCSVFKNDITDALKQSHPFIYDIAVYLTFQIEKTFSVSISSDEIALIAIYLGNVVSDTMVYDLCKVVCIVPKYNTMRNSFEKQLVNIFSHQMEIVKIISSYQEIDKTDSYDFIITTLKNEYILDDSVYCSPILTPRDVHLIQKKIESFLKKKKKERIRKKLLNYFDKDLFFYDSHQERNGDAILSYLNSILIKKNIVPDNFLNSVYRREKMASTVFFNKFALPHPLDVNSHSSKIVYYFNNNSINWFNEKVNLVLLLTSNGNDDKFADIYNLLFDILLDTDTYNSLIACKTFDELINFITEKA